MTLRALLAAVLATGLLGGCQSPGIALSDQPRDLPSGWSIEALPGARPGVSLEALKRSALVQPVRYRVIVVPGSGCTGWMPLASRYFAGLLHAEILVLHKPNVDIDGGTGAPCSPAFVQTDSLSPWRDHARAALRTRERQHHTFDALPQLLVGISEGAELLPDLAPEVSSLAGVVMISASGLDPREAGELQARRLGQLPAWQALEIEQSSGASDDKLVEGRTLRYWRDFWNWSVADRLLDAPWPLLRVWGDADELVPPTAYQRFAQRLHSRTAPFCDLSLAGANHGLQTQDRDGLQWLWLRLENWARFPAIGFCGG